MLNLPLQYIRNPPRQRERMYGRAKGNSTPAWLVEGLIATGFLPAFAASDTLIVPSLISGVIILNATVPVPDELSKFSGDLRSARLSFARFRLVDRWVG